MERKPDHTPEAVHLSSPPDPVIEAIHAFIQEERKRSFHFLAKYSHCYMNQKELLIASPADTDDIDDVRKRAGGQVTASYNGRWYTFSEPLCHRGFTRTVATDVLPGHEPTVDNMTVFCFSMKTSSYGVTPLATWLRDTYEWDNRWEMKWAEMQYDEQRLWWDTNGKAFRLLALPPEMREAVFLQIVGPVVLPDLHITSRSTKVTLGVGLSHKNKTRDGANRDPDVDRPNMTIMRVSKQVRQEATEVAYRNTTKRLRFLNAWNISTDLEAGPRSAFLSIIFSAIKESPHVAFLRNVQLEMSAERYFVFAGIIRTPRRGLPFGIHKPGARHLDILRDFTALQTLDLRFISPKHPDAMCPWSYDPRRLPIVATKKHSCQKIWIDWFFVFAWDALRALQASKFADAKALTITLSGCVKHSTRKYWQHALNDKRIDRTATIKAREQQIRREKRDNEPIPCKCSTQCAKSDGPPLFQCSEEEIRKIEGLREELDKVYWDFED